MVLAPICQSRPSGCGVRAASQVSRPYSRAATGGASRRGPISSWVASSAKLAMRRE